jgi:hypothetical protein
MEGSDRPPASKLHQGEVRAGGDKKPSLPEKDVARMDGIQQLPKRGTAALVTVSLYSGNGIEIR